MGQQAFGIRFGAPAASSINVVGCSLTAGSITVSVDGVGDTAITITEIGTDNTPTQDRAGYVGNATISGLAPYTKYTYTATQGSTSYTGHFWTAPAATDDFILFGITCDNNGSVMPGDGTPPGGYKYLREIAEANPTKGCYIAHIDDHLGYTDASTIDDSAGTGHVCTSIPAKTSSLEYDYALSAFAAFGLYSESVNAEGLFGQHEDYIWCMRNIPCLCQWGDHDCGDNEMGWQYDPTDNTTVSRDPSPKTAFDNSTAVWNAFLDPFRGTAIDAGNSEAWAHTLGCVKIIAPDGISKGSGDGTAGVGDRARPTTIFGNTQVDNVITACDDSSVPFKILLMMYGIRYLDDHNPITAQNSGAQNPLGGNEVDLTASAILPQAAHPEYARLFTDASSLMTKATCNGRDGVLFTLHGDDHKGLVLRNRNDQGTNQEWFWSFNAGTITGSQNFGQDAVAGDIVDGTEMKAGSIFDGDFSALGRLWYLRLDVYGSRPLKEVEIRSFQGARNLSLDPVLLWAGKFVEKRGGNDAHDLDVDLSFISSSGGGIGE